MFLTIILIAIFFFVTPIVNCSAYTRMIRPVPIYPEIDSRTPTDLTENQLREYLCPGVTDFGPSGNYIRYDNKTKRCYSIATRGPCNNNLIFHAEQNNSVYGQCDCENYSSTRTLIYHPQTNQCYLIFQQGYCSKGKWLALSRTNGKPLCERNPCYSSKGSDKGNEFVLVNNHCVKLHSTCGDAESGNSIMFTKGKILPHCTHPPGFAYAMGAPTITCGPGSYKSLSGNCQSSWTW